MLIKHSKFKNTGILFELLVRQITADTLSGKNSEATNILKKYFSKTELGREYKLYDSLLKRTNLTEGKAEVVINTVLESSKHLNKSSLKRQKYNLINEIKKHYNLEDFFKTKLPNYKAQAAIYTLIEGYNNDKNISHEQSISNKLFLLEHLTLSKIKSQESTDELMNEFSHYDKDTRILTYRILLDKFNNKYSDFSNNKKSILKEFINSVDNTTKLKDFYNIKINELKIDLTKLNKKTTNPVTKIKINEITNLLIELGKNDKVNNNNIVNLLQYCDLIEELTLANGK
tara:strand:+ start:387 stop:1247 length:861 start_codon:yes stop_codon:yes gene_type:complete